MRFLVLLVLLPLHTASPSHILNVAAFKFSNVDPQNINMPGAQQHMFITKEIGFKGWKL